MFRPTNKQRQLFGASADLDERLRGRLEKSWADGFQREVLPVLLSKEEGFARLYSSTGRPNWSVARMVGLLVLRELLHLKSDRELSESFAFDLRFQHALDVSEPEERVISERSIASFRARLAQGDPEGELLESVFAALSQTAIRRLGLSTKEQRTDSTFVTSNIQRRNRATLLQEVLRTFVQELARVGRLAEAPEELRAWFERLSGWEQPGANELRKLGRWMHDLADQFASDQQVTETEAYQTLCTVLHQHFVIQDEEPTEDDEEPTEDDQEPTEDDDEPTDPSVLSGPTPTRRGLSRSKPSRRPRHASKSKTRRSKRVSLEPRDAVRGAIQSPHDVDARKGRKGVGYSFQVTETSGNDGVEILTDVAVVAADRHDCEQLPDVLTRLASRAQTPEALLADGAYATLDNIERAEQHETTLWAPVHRGNLAADDPKRSREDFEFDEDGRVERCPEGHAPKRHAELRGSALPRKSLHVLFDAAQCEACSQRELCPTQTHNHGKERKLCIDPRLRERDARLVQQQTAEWRQRYRMRAGIEATVSELSRAHGAKRLSVRGKTEVRARLMLKATACNTKRLLRALAINPGTANPVPMAVRGAARRLEAAFHALLDPITSRAMSACGRLETRAA